MRTIKTGKAPTLRHIRRVHQVCVAWLHERVKSDDIDLKHCDTEAMAADNFAMHVICISLTETSG